MRVINSFFKKRQKEETIKGIEMDIDEQTSKKLYIELPEGAHVINPYGYIERGKKGIEKNTKEFLSSLFVSYGSVLMHDRKKILFAVPLRCSEETGGGGVRPSYRVGVFVSYLTDWGRLADWLKRAEFEIKKEVNETTDGFIEFYESAKYAFDFPNSTASKSDVGYTLLNVVFGNKGIKTGIGGLLAANILMRKKYSLAFYICDKDEKVEKWNFDVVISREAEEKEEYSRVYDAIIRNLGWYPRDSLESVIEITLQRMDFYPQEYVSFLVNKGEVEEIEELYRQGKISKTDLEQLGIEQKIALMEKGIVFSREDILEDIRDIILQKEYKMLEKILSFKISETLNKYGDEIKSSIEAKEFFSDYSRRIVNNKRLKELDEEGVIELLAELSKHNLLDEKMCEGVINKIESKDDLKILCKKEEIWNKREGKIRKRWNKIVDEVKEEEK